MKCCSAFFYLLSSIVAISSSSLLAQSQEAPPENKECREIGLQRHLTLGVSHLEGSGVGFNQGYSTLEAFFHPPSCIGDAWMPFLDARGHIFNDGKPAANAGMGVRHLGSQVFGVNAYYDYRDTKHQHYNQAGLGLELLGSFWDVNINGYLPFGRTKSSGFDKHSSFAYFRGHSLYLNNREKREFSMKGIDANVGFEFGNPDKQFIRVAAGPYYYSGHFGKHAVGGRAKVTAYLLKYITLDGETSYDNLFHSRTQGTISLNFSLGSRKFKKNSCTQRVCEYSKFLNRKLLQAPERSEIIVVDKHKQKKNQVAINPATGQPYIFWFVDNTSNSAGTFESPFPTLVQAQNSSSANDVIYVFAGNGTSTGMNAGIILKNNQKLFGAGISQTVDTTQGVITIPSQANGAPLLTVSSGAVIDCANTNEISGLHVLIPDLDGAVGIRCSNITNVSIHDNQIELRGDHSFLKDMVFFDLCAGEVSVNRNSLVYTSADGAGVNFHKVSSGATYLITNNQFLGQAGPRFSTGIEFSRGLFGSPLTDFNEIVISGNIFSSLASNGKPIGGSGFVGSGHLVLSGNLFSECTSRTSPETGLVLISLRAGANIKATVKDNSWVNSINPTIPSFIVKNRVAGASVCVSLTGNTSDAVPNAYVFDNTAGGSFTENASNNVGAVQELGTMTPGTCP